MYNEFIILYCCGLDYETHKEITFRSNKVDLMDLKEIYDNDNDNALGDLINPNDSLDNNFENENNNNNDIIIEDGGYIFHVKP